MSGAMHYPNYDEAQHGSLLPLPGTTYVNDKGQIRRWNGLRWYDTDTPALLRPDDPPWYREPTADKPGQVRYEDLPGRGWQWRSVGVGPWSDNLGIFDTHWSIVEARRIELEPDAVTVPVEIGLLKRLLADAATSRLLPPRCAVGELNDISALIAEARR